MRRLGLIEKNHKKYCTTHRTVCLEPPARVTVSINKPRYRNRIDRRGGAGLPLPGDVLPDLGFVRVKLLFEFGVLAEFFGQMLIEAAGVG